MLAKASALLCATALALSAMAQPKDPPADNATPPILSASQTPAVLLREDFNGDRWDPGQWSTWIQDKGLRVFCREGELRVQGKTGQPVDVCAGHHEFRFTGLVSTPSLERDVVLACSLRVRAPLPKGETRVRYLVHLCGATPDYFVDVGVSHEPDGREGWFIAPIASGYPFSHDHDYSFLALDRLPATGTYDLVVEHEAVGKGTRAFVVNGATWHPLGEHRVFLATTQVELKVDVPYDDVSVDVAYDDVRLYRRPQEAPVRVVLIRPPFPGFPMPGATVTLSDESGKVLATGESDRDGEARLTLPSERLYPAGGMLTVMIDGEAIGHVPIRSSGVEGVYPGDLWRVSLPEAYRETEDGYPLGM